MLSTVKITKQIHKEHISTLIDSCQQLTMKPTFVTTLCFFFFAFTTYFPSAFTQFAEIVKDVNGNPIVPSKRYYIWPNYFEKGGEVRLGNTGNTSLVVLACP